MATQTLSAADAILKDLYVGPIVEQLWKLGCCLNTRLYAGTPENPVVLAYGQ